MSFRPVPRRIAFFLPLLLAVIGFALPYASTRLSLLLHGHPFARVVPKEQLPQDIFHYVPTDSFACRAIVFTGNQPIGWVCAPSIGGYFPWFVPFTTVPHTLELELPGRLEIPLPILWFFRWWLLGGQAVFVLLWFAAKYKWIPVNI